MEIKLLSLPVGHRQKVKFSKQMVKNKNITDIYGYDS